MQLPEFITKTVSFFTSTEERLNKLSLAEKQVVDLTAANQKLTADLATTNQSLATAQTALATEQTEHGKTKGLLTAAQATIADPKGEIQRVAAIKANEIATKMGVPPLKADDHTIDANGGKSLAEQYSELNAKDPKAAAKFAAEHGGALGLMGS